MLARVRCSRFAKPFPWYLAALFTAFACSEPSSPVKNNPPPAEPSRDPPFCSFERPPSHAEKPAPAPAVIRAAYAERVLDMPIGAPLGGYGDRLTLLGQATPADARPKRFTKGFVPSVGMHDAPKAHVTALEVGGERLALVGLDVPLLNENSLFELEAKTEAIGPMRGRIILSASHSHAAWAGWQPSLVLMPGIDRPRSDLSDRLLNSVAQAIADAFSALEDAKIGFAVEKQFDPNDTVSSDRRGENDAVLGPDGNTAGMNKDPIVWAMRIDRADGTPLSAIVNLPVHGTLGEGSNPLVSTDLPGAIGRSLSNKLGYPVMHLQGAAGDITPKELQSRKNCPGAARCLDMPGIEIVAGRAADLAAPLVEGIQTSDKAAMEVVTRTFYSGREAVVKRPDGTELRYAPADVEPDGILFDSMGKISNPIDEFNTATGAGLCGDRDAGSFAPLAGAADVYLSCLDVGRGQGFVLGLFDVPPVADMPLCDTIRTTATAVRIAGTSSGDWLLLTIPGEPTAPFASYLRGRSPAGADKTLLIGYAGDHVGYVLTAEDWLAGGYEPSTNIWGPLEGEIAMDGILEAAALAWTPQVEDPEDGSSRFLNWVFPDAKPLEITITADHGQPAPNVNVWWPDTVNNEAGVPAAMVPRAVGTARFAWFGGDPAVDMPDIFIEYETMPDVFEPLVDSRGKPAGSRDGAVVLSYTPEPLTADKPGHHIFAALWQPVPADPFGAAEPQKPYSLPLGRYRFHVKGRAMAAQGAVDYELTSIPFEVTEAPLSLDSSAKRAGNSIELQASLGQAPGMRALQDGPSDVDIPLPGPWTLEITFADATVKSLMVMPDSNGLISIPLSAAEVLSAMSVNVRDAMGNGGILTVQ